MSASKKARAFPGMLVINKDQPRQVKWWGKQERESMEEWVHGKEVTGKEGWNWEVTGWGNSWVRSEKGRGLVGGLVGH